MYSIDAGIMEYEDALALQIRMVDARLRKRLTSDLVIWVQHAPVFTLGFRGGRENLLVSAEFLSRKKIKIVETRRGGNITYHGPGQLVAYPIMDLDAARTGITEYIGFLEQVMLGISSDFGVAAQRRDRNRGVWVEDKKLGSVGVAVRRGIAYHGLALNVDVDLMPFQWINPCGLKETAMTSLCRELSADVSVVQARERAQWHLAQTFGRKLSTVALEWIEESMDGKRVEAV